MATKNKNTIKNTIKIKNKEKKYQKEITPEKQLGIPL